MAEPSIVATKIVIRPLPPEGIQLQTVQGVPGEPVEGVPAQGIPVAGPSFNVDYQQPQAMGHRSPASYDPWAPTHDPCCNLFWVLLVLGMLFPPFWICGLLGICSDKTNERIAGLFNAFAISVLVVVVGAAFVIR